MVNADPYVPPPSTADDPQEPVDSTELEDEVHPVVDGAVADNAVADDPVDETTDETDNG